MSISSGEIDKIFIKLKDEAEKSAYHLNPDEEMTKELIEGLLINQERYGYWACPCRPAEGKRLLDKDIICPCDYRDADVDEYDACYCGLYVSSSVMSGEKIVKPIPERRPSEEQRTLIASEKNKLDTSGLPFPVWRCPVCGYLCARENPPEKCPICKADKDRFQRFL
ncbi:MAG: hypothetical protein JXR70_01860 [Spirochaetales bacterium]|nr:hypothetical protein [Spirochaetales bacterium]